MTYELYSKIAELRSLIKDSLDVGVIISELGTKRDLYDMVLINSINPDGKVRVFPKRVKGVDASKIGYVKTTCYAYVRKDLYGRGVVVKPLSRNDVLLQHASGFDEVKYENWLDYAILSRSFTHPTPKSKVWKLINESLPDEHEEHTINECDVPPYKEIISLVNVYLYFRKAVVSDFIPSEKYTVMIGKNVTDIIAVWCQETGSNDEYIGFRKKDAQGTWIPYNDYTSDNTALLEELGIPFAILKLKNSDNETSL